jgi:hypothetical protein
MRWFQRRGDDVCCNPHTHVRNVGEIHGRDGTLVGHRSKGVSLARSGFVLSEVRRDKEPQPIGLVATIGALCVTPQRNNLLITEQRRCLRCEGISKRGNGFFLSPSPTTEGPEAAMKRFAAVLMLAGIFATAAYAADGNCCKTCCKGAMCMMTHGRAHDCSGHPPCK